MQAGTWTCDRGKADRFVTEARLGQARERQFERRHHKAHNLAIHSFSRTDDKPYCLQ